MCTDYVNLSGNYQIHLDQRMLLFLKACFQMSRPGGGFRRKRQRKCKNTWIGLIDGIPDIHQEKRLPAGSPSSFA
jgi:hypothetical protein